MGSGFFAGSGVVIQTGTHKRVYVGPYIKFPTPAKLPCPDGDRLMLAASENFDTWLPDVGVFQTDNHGDTPDPCSLTADMISTKAFTDAFSNEITKLRELYGTKDVIEFGIVTISNETPW